MIDLSLALAVCQDWKDNIAQFKAILRDYYPNGKRDVNVVLTVLTSGVAEKLSQEKFIDEIIAEKYIMILDKEYGVQPDVAIVALKAWTQALGVRWNLSDIEKSSIVNDKGKQRSLQQGVESQIEEQRYLKILLEDFTETGSLRSCCSIIDIYYKYAVNLHDEYSKTLQLECYRKSLEYLEKLKTLLKCSEKEVNYYYYCLALYVEGTLRFINADLLGAIKVYKECASYSIFDGIEREQIERLWIERDLMEKINIEFAVHSNLYFIYDLLGLEFERSIEKPIVDKAVQPLIDLAKDEEIRLKKEIQNNPQRATEPWNPNFQSDDLLTLHDFCVKEIEEYQSWVAYPKLRCMDIEFLDYGSRVFSKLSEAVSGGAGPVIREYNIYLDNNAIVLDDGISIKKKIVTQFSEIRNELYDKIRLLL